MYTTFQMYQKIVSICFNRRMSPRGTPSNHEWRTVQDVTCAQPDLDEPAIARCHHVGTWVMQKTWFPKKKWDVSLNRGRVKLTNLLLLKARDGLEGHQCLRRFQTLMQLWMFYATFCHIWQVWWTLKIPKTAQRSGCGSLRFQKNIILTSPAKPQKTLEFSLDLRPWGGDSIMNRFLKWILHQFLHERSANGLIGSATRRSSIPGRTRDHPRPTTYICRFADENCKTSSNSVWISKLEH